MSFDTLFKFEQALADYAGAPYAVVTDCCTHAIELCFRMKKYSQCSFTKYTYVSVPQTLLNLGVRFDFIDESWIGEYQFHGTNIWDSARLLRPGMYRSGQLQCLSFGRTKPLELGRAGAILLDDPMEYAKLSRWRSDGRDLRILPWEEQKRFGTGYHYCPTLEICQQGLEKLSSVDPEPKYHQYPDLNNIDFID